MQAKFDKVDEEYFLANGKEYKILVWNTTTFMSESFFLLKQTFNSQPFFSVETAREYKEVCFSQYQWSLRSGLRYCFALISTVGYGDYIPQTQAGKIFTFFYMIIGEFPVESHLISHIQLSRNSSVPAGDCIISNDIEIISPSR